MHLYQCQMQANMVVFGGCIDIGNNRELTEISNLETDS